MDEVRPDHVHAVEVEALEQRELLQRHRPLAPRRLADRVVAVVVGERRLDAGLPLRHVLPGEHAGVRRAAGVHHLLRAAELVDRLGDEALRPDLARLLDLRDAVAAGALGFLQHARVGRGECLVGEHHALLGHLAVRADRPRPRSASARGTASRPWRWWRWRARPADGRSARRRSRASARRRASWCRSRAAAASRCRTCRGCRRRAGRCPAPCRGLRACSARWWRRRGRGPGRR